MPADDDLTTHLDELLGRAAGRWRPNEGEARQIPEGMDMLGPKEGESKPNVAMHDTGDGSPPSPFFNDGGQDNWVENERLVREHVDAIGDDGGFLQGRDVDFRDMPDLETNGTPYVPFIMESPVQALDLHLSHWAFTGSAAHRTATETFLYSYYGSEKGDPPEAAVTQFVRQESDWLHSAITNYVDPDVSYLVEQMGLAMPPDMLRPTDLPMREGFVVFGKTWDYLNFHMNTYIGKIPIRAIAWKVTDFVGQPVKTAFEPQTFLPGVYLMLYTDKGWLNHIRTMPTPDDYTGPLILSDLWGWTFDTWWEDIDHDDPDAIPDQHHASMHVGEMRRKLLALWRFMADEIVRTRRTRMPRPALRRWSRTGKDIPEDGSIVTVHLRRIKPVHRESEGEETDAPEWSHRWWVRGHYRFNPKTGQKDIWIRPYVKGPDDKPIVVKEKLISVDR